jgi:hypothetical protein
MRRSFFKKLSIALLALLWIGWAGFVYASPREWKEVSGIFIALTAIYAFRMWAAGRAADREAGFAPEQLTGGKGESGPMRKEEPNQPLQRNASTRSVSNFESPARRG